MSDGYKHKSKFLSLVLRHEPSAAGVTLDEAGWVDVDVLLAGCAAHGQWITLEELREIVRTSDKQRFALSQDGLRIRANQGHSVEVELGHAPASPPEVLYHGTGRQHVASIRASGLQKQKRHHVHLSEGRESAAAVGRRQGKLAMIEIRAGEMSRDGFVFFKTPNNVWLTDHVPVKYLVFVD